MKMPWRGIIVRTAQVAAVTAVTLTALAYAGVRYEREEQAQLARFRWTDEARWDR